MVIFLGFLAPEWPESYKLPVICCNSLAALRAARGARRKKRATSALKTLPSFLSINKHSASTKYPQSNPCYGWPALLVAHGGGV